MTLLALTAALTLLLGTVGFLLAKDPVHQIESLLIIIVSAISYAGYCIIETLYGIKRELKRSKD
jgi:energy-converting hydrogenase Eha subunit C